MVSWEITYNPASYLAGVWEGLRISAHPRYAKLGERVANQWGGIRQVIRLECRGLGRLRGYYLDMHQPDRFLDALNRAIDRYRARAV